MPLLWISGLPKAVLASALFCASKNVLSTRNAMSPLPPPPLISIAVEHRRDATPNRAGALNHNHHRQAISNFTDV